MVYTAYTDGGYDNLRHRNAYSSFAIICDDGLVHSDTFILNTKSSNESEYEGLYKLLEYVVTNNLHLNSVWKIFSDSKLVVMQVNGRWGVAATNLKPYNKKVKDLIRKFDNVELAWCPRATIVSYLGH